MNTNHVEELDLVISDMDSGVAELAVKNLLRNMSGVISVALAGRGAFVRYNLSAVNGDHMCAAIRQIGYKASVLHEADTGQAGESQQHQPGQ